MAQSMTRPTAAGRVNRRFLFLALILAGLSAVLVYALLSRSDSGGAAGGADAVSVVVANAAIPAGTTITADMIGVQSVPASVVGDQPFRTTEAVIGQVMRYPVAANEQLLLTKVVGGVQTFANDNISAIVEEGMRAFAINMGPVTGAGGLVLPGDHVDVLWVPDEVLEDHENAMLVAENVEVLAVQQTIVDLPPTAPGFQEQAEEGAAATSGERVRGSDEEPIPDATTVTLMLSPQVAQLVFCAEAAGSLRLAVRGFGDNSPSGIPPATCVLVADGQG